MLVSGRVSFEMISLSNPAPSGSGFILSRGPLRLRKKNTGEVAKKHSPGISWLECTVLLIFQMLGENPKKCRSMYGMFTYTYRKFNVILTQMWVNIAYIPRIRVLWFGVSPHRFWTLLCRVCSQHFCARIVSPSETVLPNLSWLTSNHLTTKLSWQTARLHSLKPT